LEIDHSKLYPVDAGRVTEFSKNVIIFTVPDEKTKKAASPDTAFLFLT